MYNNTLCKEIHKTFKPACKRKCRTQPLTLWQTIASWSPRCLTLKEQFADRQCTNMTLK